MTRSDTNRQGRQRRGRQGRRGLLIWAAVLAAGMPAAAYDHLYDHATVDWSSGTFPSGVNNESWGFQNGSLLRVHLDSLVNENMIDLGL